MEIKVINSTYNDLPSYETEASAGCDLRANIYDVNTKFLFNADLFKDEFENPDYVLIQPGGRALIPTGLKMSLPIGYEAQVRPRSGLALKHGITVLNSPGTIDADYRGDIGIILINHSDRPFKVEQGDRIAQLVIAKYEQVEFVVVDDLDETDRGAGGFGSTGVE